MSDQNTRQMTPEELVAHGYPSNFHQLPRHIREAIVEGLANQDFKLDINEGMALRRDNEQATPPRQARDRAVYTRQQKGHSLILNLLLVGPLTLYITTVYWSVSPNHYWHA